MAKNSDRILLVNRNIKTCLWRNLTNSVYSYVYNCTQGLHIGYLITYASYFQVIARCLTAETFLLYRFLFIMYH